MADREIDQISGTETTGHQWDGIKELNTPLPRWWLWTFYATVIWSAGYALAYPAVPLITENTKGLLGYSSRADVANEITKAKEAQGELLSQVSASSLEDIRANPDLLRFAVAGGASAFRVNCVQCHGAGAAGGGIYPNLNDDDWLWGGSLEQIHTTLMHGVRFAQDPDTRVSDMPAFGRDGIMTRDQISDTAEYVLALAGREHDAEAAARAAEPYAENCAVCHGDDGKGNHDLGAPDLTDAIWFYGSSKEEIAAQIANPKLGVMPAWSQRLDEATIKQLALYVHSLGGGQ